jgi:hypothetical protein
MGATPDAYSQVAGEQLDQLYATSPDTFNDVLTVCELIFHQPPQGPVHERLPLPVEWTSDVYGLLATSS